METVIHELQKVIAEKTEENDLMYKRMQRLEQEMTDLRSELGRIKADYDKVSHLYIDVSGSYFAVSERLRNYETADKVPTCRR